MFCPKCGTQLSENSIFCSSCGAQLNQQQSEPHQPVYAKPKVPGLGLGIASMILGIIGLFPSFMYLCFAIYINIFTNILGKSEITASDVLVFMLCFFFCSIFSILSFLFGLVSNRKGYKGGMCMAGIITGGIGLFLCLISLLSILV